MSFFTTPVTANEYADLLGRLLPRGKAWATLLQANGLTLTVKALSYELARAHNRFLDLLDESDPRTTTELIDAWERVLGLPDPCDLSPPTTLADRRDAAFAALIARGGTQLSILCDVIAAAGYDTFEIQQPILLRGDIGKSDQRVYDDEWASFWYVWRLTTPPQGWERLQCLLDRLKHSWTSVVLIDGLRANEVALPT